MRTEIKKVMDAYNIGLNYPSMATVNNLQGAWIRWAEEQISELEKAGKELK